MAIRVLATCSAGSEKYRTACALAPARLITQPLRSWAAASAAAPADVHPECHCILYDGIVSAQPAEYGDQYDLIHLGGETAVVVPLDEYQRLRALERRASAEDLDAAEADAIRFSSNASIAYTCICS